MRNPALFGAIVIGLAGCAAPLPPATPFGNFAQITPPTAARMADDAVRKLVVLYPPASTRFDLQQPTQDAFGNYFVKAMRERGYAVLEYQAGNDGPNNAATSDSTRLPLAYIIDQNDKTREYRLTLLVDRQSLDRLYLVADDGTLRPAGYWARRN